jgi:hypothetical protein
MMIVVEEESRLIVPLSYPVHEEIMHSSSVIYSLLNEDTNITPPEPFLTYML